MEASRSYILRIYFILTLMYFISAQEVSLYYKDSAEMGHFFKRTPNFFVGVKGKKNRFDNTENDIVNSQMKFVRQQDNKEYFPSDVVLNRQNEYSTGREIEDLYNKYFLLLKECKNCLQNLKGQNSDENHSEISLSNESIEPDMVNNNRAETLHDYFSIRGKKSGPYDLTFRWKFIGVRGKKNMKDIKTDSAYNMRFLQDQSKPWPKRKTQMGFFGMRGKKWTNEPSPEIQEVY